MAKTLLTLEFKAASGQGLELFRELDAVGINANEARAMFEDVFEEMGKTALQTYKSAVPIRTQQLRGFIKMQSSNRVLKVVSVEDAIHDRSKTREPITGGLLADILEEGQHRLGPRRRTSGRPYRRSKGAKKAVSFEIANTAMGQPTKNWATNALAAISEDFGIGN